MKKWFFFMQRDKIKVVTMSIFALVLLLGLIAAACKKEENTTQVGSAEPAEQRPAVDPNLAKAMAAASGAAANEQEGPPADGVFGPGGADRELAKGSPPVLKVGNLGEEPRVRIGSMQPQPGTKLPFDLELSIRVGRNMTPNIKFGMLLEVPKPKAAEAPPAGGPVEVVTKVVSATLDPEQATQLPESERKLVQKFKGGTLTYRVAPSGGATDFHVELAKGADAGLQQPLDALGEMVGAATLPVPDQPVGKGGQWMITTRESVAGIETVTYRLVTVENVEGNTLTLTMTVKRYAVSSELRVPEAPKELGELKLVSFQGAGNGRLVLRSGVPFPVGGEIASQLSAMASSPNMPGQGLPIIQAQTTAEISSAGGAAKRPAAATPRAH